MHNLLSRSNSVLTLASTLLFTICVLTTITDIYFVPNGVGVHVELKKVENLIYDRHSGNDRAILKLALDADLRGAFSWNTKQLFLYVQAEYTSPDNKINQLVLWDTILVNKGKALVKKKLRQEYFFEDDGRHLRGRAFNLTVAWNVMPKLGRLYTNSKTFANFQLPSEYTSRAKS